MVSDCKDDHLEEMTPLLLKTNSVERLRITSGGLVGIGKIPLVEKDILVQPVPLNLLFRTDLQPLLLLQSSDETANWRATIFIMILSDVEWFSGRPYSSTDA